MPTIEENKQTWNAYAWSKNGDEWSRDFGGTEALWFFVLYPRIHRFLPASTILEIAPGFGRWTQFLKTHCRSLIAVDLSEKCIQHCKRRFASETHIQFHLNDGTSLAAVRDDSIDFAFSFDSLVHAEREVLEGYLTQLARKLTPDGIGFIHHSNLGAYPGRVRLLRYYERLPEGFQQKLLRRERISAILSLNVYSNRASSMTAGLFRGYCEKVNLKCIHQEIINWSKGTCLVDAISIFTKPNSRWDTARSSLNNHDFVEGASVCSRLAKLYCSCPPNSPDR